MIALARASVAAALLVASAARAESIPPAKSKPARMPAVEHRVDFRAEEVEIDPESGALVLKRNVVVTAHRFRLTSEEWLTLTRSTRGLHVRGKGRLGLCQCEGPPITFGFGAADLAPPTDVLLQGATLRVASVPVFYAPYFWIRAPNRTGMVPPSLAYRGEEGLVGGSGLHVPLDQEGGKSALAAHLFGYSRGGGRARFEIATLRGRAALAIDHLRETGLDLEGNFATTSATGAAAAFRADWVAGERARISLARIDRVALPTDRVRLSVGRAGLGVLGFQLMADARRAGSLERVGNVGPGLVMGRTVALAPGAIAHAAVESQTGHTPEGALFRAHADAGVSVAIAVSPAIVELHARERADVATRAQDSASELSSDLGLRIGVPLVRRYGTFVHVVEPTIAGAVVSAIRTEPSGESLLPDDPTPFRSMALLLGVENALGEPSGRSALDLRLGGGLAGEAPRPMRVASGRLRADTRLFRAQADALGAPEEHAAELTLRAELGERSRLWVGARADAKLGDTPLPRRLWENDAAALRVSPLNGNGWSLGGHFGVPWGRNFDTELGSDWDIASGRWLAAAGSLGYRHPCRCLSMRLMGSRRIGRRSFDAELSLELVP